MTLKDLIEEVAWIEGALSQNGGELTEELEAHLSEWEKNFEEKIDGYGEIITRFKMLQEHWNDKAATAAKMKKSIKALEDRLKERLKFGMKALNKHQVAGDNYKFTLSSLKPKVKIVDAAVLPDFVYDTETIKKINKTRISDELCLGRVVPGAELEEVEAIRMYESKGV